MWSGSIWATRCEVLALHAERETRRCDPLDGRVDVVCYGVPTCSPYAAFAGMNPLLTLALIST